MSMTLSTGKGPIKLRMSVMEVCHNAKFCNHALCQVKNTGQLDGLNPKLGFRGKCSGLLFR